MPSEHNDNRSRWIKTLLLSLAITIALNSIGAGFCQIHPICGNGCFGCVFLFSGFNRFKPAYG